MAHALLTYHPVAAVNEVRFGRRATGSQLLRLVLAGGASVIGASCALPTQPSRTVEPTVVLAPNVFVITSARQIVEGDVRVESDVEWEVSATAEWIVPVKARGVGSGRFVLQAHPNLCGGAPRVAHIRVVPGRAYVPVEQGGADLGLCPSIDRRGADAAP